MIFDIIKTRVSPIHIIKFLLISDSESHQFSAYFLTPEELEGLEKFDCCRCINVCHSKLNFHSVPFDDNVFLPAFLASTKLLGNVWWSRQVLDLSKTTFDDEFFETVQLRDPKNVPRFPFSNDQSSLVDGFDKNYFQFQRMLLFHQGFYFMCNNSMRILLILRIFNIFTVKFKGS